MSEWLRDRTDPRVIAALERKCPVCKSAPDDDCGHPIGDRIIHAIRTPADVLFGAP